MKKWFLIFAAAVICMVSAAAVGAGEKAEIKAGDYVSFGSYPQTAEGTDKTPIEWLVLDVQDGTALLISRYALETIAYDENRDKSITWEISGLRAWMNEEFLNSAFTPEEQAAILTTDVDNSDETIYRWEDPFAALLMGATSVRASGGNDTRDKVFALCCTEAQKYFETTPEDQVTGARAAPTDYALAHDPDLKEGKYQTEDGKDSVSWWLRSPAYYADMASCVENDGKMDTTFVFNEKYCARPALWADLNTDFFR